MISMSINNLCLKYDSRTIFNNLSFEMNDYQSYSIMGPSGCGKSSLLKCLIGSIKYDGTINCIDNSINYIRGKRIPFMSICSEEFSLNKENLKEEFEYILLNRGFRSSDINFIVDEFVSYFKIDDLLEKKYIEYSYTDNALASLLCATIIRPDVLLVDDLFKYFDRNFKSLFVKHLNTLGITLINVVSDSNDALYTEYLFVFMNNGRIAIEGKTISVFKEEKLIRRLGFDLPFMVDLSIQLQCYELLDGITLNMKDMVNKLWK